MVCLVACLAHNSPYNTHNSPYNRSFTVQNTMFKPKNYPIRKATDNSKRNGQILNPPRLPEIGGMTKSNGDRREDTLSLRKPGGEKSPS